MSIIDRNSIFFEGPLTANAAGNPVPLTGLKIPGRMEPIPLRLSVTEAFLPAETQGLTISMMKILPQNTPMPSSCIRLTCALAALAHPSHLLV